MCWCWALCRWGSEGFFWGARQLSAFSSWGFLFDANFLASLMFPVGDPVYMLSFLVGHIAGVAASGLFAAIFVVALQSLLLAVLGERFFRKISLVLQGGAVTVLVMLFCCFRFCRGLRRHCCNRITARVVVSAVLVSGDVPGVAGGRCCVAGLSRACERGLCGIAG